MSSASLDPAPVGSADVDERTIELSIVMPCLNEAETLEGVSRKRKGVAPAQCSGEVVIADNGSTDGSQAIATRLGARVVNVEGRATERPHGRITNAHGTFVVMGDADDSYDFTAIMPLVDKLREGYDLVMGNRFLGHQARCHAAVASLPWESCALGVGRLFFPSPCHDFTVAFAAFVAMPC
jgi:glycosyltransferase involved in cell wall biosynthesis